MKIRKKNKLYSFYILTFILLTTVNCLGSIKKIEKRKFTSEEDEALKELVKKYGTSNWITISRQMSERNSRQCRERWLNNLNPEINRDSWTQEEDEKILKLQAKLGNKWKLIAKSFEGRTDQQIKNRYNLLQRKEKRSLRKNKHQLLPKNQNDSLPNEDNNIAIQENYEENFLDEWFSKINPDEDNIFYYK